MQLKYLSPGRRYNIIFPHLLPLCLTTKVCRIESFLWECPMTFLYANEDLNSPRTYVYVCLYIHISNFLIIVRQNYSQLCYIFLPISIWHDTFLKTRKKCLSFVYLMLTQDNLLRSVLNYQTYHFLLTYHTFTRALNGIKTCNWRGAVLHIIFGQTI